MWTITMADGSTWEGFEFGATSDLQYLRIGLETKSTTRAAVAFTDPEKTCRMTATDGIRNVAYEGYTYLDSMFSDEFGRVTFRLTRGGTQ